MQQDALTAQCKPSAVVQLQGHPMHEVMLMLMMTMVINFYCTILGETYRQQQFSSRLTFTLR
jgi:hypothetical protein